MPTIFHLYPTAMFYPLFLILFVAITTCSFASDAMDTTKHSGDTAPVKTDTTTTKYGVLTGTVTDSAGNPLVGATVLVEGTRRGTYTKNDGKFTILRVPPGEYIVRAKSLGFKDYTITCAEVKEGDTVSIDIVLTLDKSVRVFHCPTIDYKLLMDPETIGTIRRISSEELQSTPP